MMKPTSIDEYILRFPETTQVVLRQLRETIRKVAPQAEEAISYGIPTFRENNTYLIYFAGYKKHVSLYPSPRDSESDKQLLSYLHGKGTLQFPLDEPLPIKLIERVIRKNIAENKTRGEKQPRSKTRDRA